MINCYINLYFNNTSNELTAVSSFNRLTQNTVSLNNNISAGNNWFATRGVFVNFQIALVPQNVTLHWCTSFSPGAETA
jgi:hypothetical protein